MHLLVLLSSYPLVYKLIYRVDTIASLEVRARSMPANLASLVLFPPGILRGQARDQPLSGKLHDPVGDVPDLVEDRSAPRPRKVWKPIQDSGAAGHPCRS